MNLFIIQLALVGLVLTLACGTQPTNTSQAPPIEDAQIPPMGEWPCSVEDKKGRITYPKLVNEAKRYAAPFPIGASWWTSSNGKLSEDGMYSVVSGFEVVDVQHEIEGLLDPLTCEMKPSAIRKYDGRNRLLDEIHLSE